MEPDLVLTNATVLDAEGLHAGVDVAIRDGVIVGREPSRPVPPGVAAEECRGRLLLPGFANAHHHFYSGLLRGAPPPATPPRTQRERLERVVWPFERRLRHADVRAAVRAGLLEAVLAGTTAVVDHHVSSGCVGGVLDVVAEEVAASGLRAVLSYEMTDRDGEAVAAAGLAETERFLAALGSNRDRIAGMVGLHAMSTVGPGTLVRAAALAERFGVGLHLHLGEAAHDNDDSLARYGARPVARLAAAGGLSPLTLAAHAVHVAADEAALLGERGVLVAHLPRSNASNGVGVADLALLARAGCTVGLGGDGFTQDIRADLALVPLLQRQERRDPTLLPPPAAVNIGVGGNAAILERLAGWRTGRLAPGHLADLVALAYDPVVPLRPGNAYGHLAAGLPGAAVRDVWVGGHRLLRDGECVTLDAERIRREAADRFAALWVP